jgi:predicted anti-sigma-YlaC factor YlaD
MPVDELSCRELVEIVTEYLEGALSPQDYARFERHLGLCEGCTIYVDQMRETVRLTGMLREDQIPEGARTALLDAFRGWKSAP